MHYCASGKDVPLGTTTANFEDAIAATPVGPLMRRVSSTRFGTATFSGEPDSCWIPRGLAEILHIRRRMVQLGPLLCWRLELVCNLTH